MATAAVAIPSLGGTSIDVTQVDRKFEPTIAEVTSGTTIRFLNNDPIVHHVFVDTPGFAFDSGDIPAGSAVSFTFDKTGRFAVRCAIHPHMRFEVTVRD